MKSFILKEYIMNLDLNFIPYPKINSEWIAHLNVEGETITILGDNIRETTKDAGLGYEVLNMTPSKY
jgi:hypothetical protein